MLRPPSPSLILFFLRNSSLGKARTPEMFSSLGRLCRELLCLRAPPNPTPDSPRPAGRCAAQNSSVPPLVVQNQGSST
ncbi:hypothetical protein I79_019789 [Cricetulus griseus]|uniref:Uncharacterized protein n=1 Tax=Cricetulus griseus TaxID=10029 RepID=G3I8C5_CRIGR|nr:hypothetical protein I79_019789 [Cricetulus griseus]